MEISTRPTVRSFIDERELAYSVSEVVAGWEESNPGSLPRVDQGPILVLASDYSGQHKSSDFEIFTFLVSDYVFLGLWDKLRSEVRKRFLPDGRRMAFKSLNDKVKRRALAPFLVRCQCHSRSPHFARNQENSSPWNLHGGRRCEELLRGVETYVPWKVWRGR